MPSLKQFNIPLALQICKIQCHSIKLRVFKGHYFYRSLDKSYATTVVNTL